MKPKISLFIGGATEERREGKANLFQTSTLPEGSQEETGWPWRGGGDEERLPNRRVSFSHVAGWVNSESLQLGFFFLACVHLTKKNKKTREGESKKKKKQVTGPSSKRFFSWKHAWRMRNSLGPLSSSHLFLLLLLLLLLFHPHVVMTDARRSREPCVRVWDGMMLGEERRERWAELSRILL